ncbi:hypothetical protein [Methylobacterium sp.]|uniref:hypothetical protein n=1 Tax=Methylobacterium sp. TaxID=409 RepID=UPI003B0284A1
MGQVQSYEYLWGTMRWRVLREKLEKLDFSDGDRRIAEIRAECDRQCQIIALRRVLRDQLISIIDACVVDGRFNAERARAVVLPDFTSFEEIIGPLQRLTGRPRKEGNEARIANPPLQNVIAAFLTRRQTADTEKPDRAPKRGPTKKATARPSHQRARTGGPRRK